MTITPELQQAGDTILNCYKQLEAEGSNVVWELLKNEKEVLEWQHYPKGDVRDKDNHSQYYYHSHHSHDSDRVVEHGHFHLFLHKTAISDEIVPVLLSDKYVDTQGKEDALTHLVAIAMNNIGQPTALFTTNHWVVKGLWYPAEVMIPLIDRFAIQKTSPFPHTNQWITSMIKLFKEPIIELLYRRDEIIQEWQETHPKKNVYQDKRLEVTSVLSLTA